MSPSIWKVTVLGCFALRSIAVGAQTTTVSASIDSNTIRIGEQVSLLLRIDHRVDDGADTIIWPVIGDTLPQRIEVVSQQRTDTALIDAAHDPYGLRESRRILITCFDSGHWVLEPLPFIVNGDTLLTQPVLLNVRTVEVDTAQAFRPIKDIYDLPFSWEYWFKEHWPWFAGGAGAIATAVIVLLEVRRRRRLSKGIIPPEEVKPLHVRTLLALEEVEKKKLWQQGLVKQHHSEVTDILRGYIEQRFHVPALERTTDELMQELALSSMGAAHRERLNNLLRLADMVKFAKWTPTPTENEQVLQGAMLLVRETAESATPITTISPDAPRS